MTNLANVGSNHVAHQTNTIINGTIGSINEYSLEEDWSLWVEPLEQYYLANEVPQHKQVPLLLTLLGKDAYALLRNLCSPTKPSDLPLKRLIEILKNHLQPAPSIVMERYKFKMCTQQAGEDVKTYVANLKKLTTHCEFGTGLEDSLRDQFVWGVASENIKRRLLSEKDLTYQKAIDLAVSLEAAGRDAVFMHPCYNQQAKTCSTS